MLIGVLPRLVDWVVNVRAFNICKYFQRIIFLKKVLSFAGYELHLYIWLLQILFFRDTV